MLAALLFCNFSVDTSCFVEIFHTVAIDLCPMAATEHFLIWTPSKCGGTP